MLHNNTKSHKILRDKVIKKFAEYTQRTLQNNAEGKFKISEARNIHRLVCFYTKHTVHTKCIKF